MELSIHRIVKITKRSRPKKLYDDGSVYTQRFCFENDDGARFYITCFANDKDNLKIQGGKHL